MGSLSGAAATWWALPEALPICLDPALQASGHLQPSWEGWVQSQPRAPCTADSIPLDLGARPLCRRLRGRGCANCQSLPQAELFVTQRERPGLPSQVVAWPPRLRAGRRESGSQRPWLGEAALCDPMDCSPSGSCIHGVFQARILECIAIPFSRGSS